MPLAYYSTTPRAVNRLYSIKSLSRSKMGMSWELESVTKLTLVYTLLVFLICNTLSMTFHPAGGWQDLFQLLFCTVSQHASFWCCVHHDRLWFASISSAWAFSSDCRNAVLAAPEINEVVREALPGVKPGSRTTYRPQALELRLDRRQGSWLVPLGPCHEDILMVKHNVL